MDDKASWDLYFAGIVGWTLHPGYLRENAERPNLEECAKLADEMLKIKQEREKCLGLEEQ